MKNTTSILAVLTASALCLAAYATIHTTSKVADLEAQVELLRKHMDSPPAESQTVASLLSAMETRVQRVNARLDRLDQARPATGEEIAAFREQLRVVREIREDRPQKLFDMFATLDQARAAMRNEIGGLQADLLALRAQVLSIMQNPTESRLMPANRE